MFFGTYIANPINIDCSAKDYKHSKAKRSLDN